MPASPPPHVTRHVSRITAFILIALFVGVTYWIPNNLYQRLPRLEDEVAELWQARVFASGHLSVSSPPAAEAFSVPFVVDYHGARFSKYPPGHAALLALGVLMGEPWIVNLLLTALALAMLYRFGRELFGARLALLALALAATSPILLMLSASLMPHAASVLSSTLFIWAFFRLQNAFSRPSSAVLRLSLLTGLALGLAFLIRPFTALCLAVPLAVIALGQLRANPRAALARYAPLVIAAALISALLPLYNYLLTGELRLDLYTLWWPYDHPGFGASVGPQGYYLGDVLKNAWLGLWSLNYDLLGWLYLSLIPVALGLALKPRTRLEWHLAAYPAALFVGYLAFFHQSRLYGPRYYAEAIAPLVFLVALGIRKLAYLPPSAFRLPPPASRLLLPVSCFLLIASNLLFYLPLRFTLLRDLYDGALNWQAVDAARAGGLHSAIVFIFADNWPDAAAGLLSNSVDLGDNVLFARYLGPESFDAVRAAYPGRALWFWREGALTPASLPPPEWVPRCPTVCPPG